MASKRRLRRNMCGQKKRYESEAAARASISTIAKRGGLGHYVVPYRCKFCNAFHFGAPPARVRQAMRA